MVEKKALSVSNVKHTYDNNDFILKGVDLTVEKGEIVSLLGPSGSGKTTLLRLIAGLENLKFGSINIKGTEVASVKSFIPTHKRNVGLVVQERVLFPHITVLKNVIFGIKANKNEKITRGMEILRLFKIDKYANHYPSKLSSGEQQRVAIARAIAPNPRILLMDEPFGNLDEKLRIELRLETKKIIKENNITSIIVTHDIEDAKSISDKIIKIENGKIIEKIINQNI